MNKQDLRPLYEQLQGILAQTPKDEVIDKVFYNDTVWDFYHAVIDELGTVTGEKYDTFRLRVRSIDWNRTVKNAVSVTELRIKLGGLISRLHGQYFNDEPPPFSGMPSTIIHQTQTQEQKTSLELFVRFNETLDDQIRNQYRRYTGTKLPRKNQDLFSQCQ